MIFKSFARQTVSTSSARWAQQAAEFYLFCRRPSYHHHHHHHHRWVSEEWLSWPVPQPRLCPAPMTLSLSSAERLFNAASWCCCGREWEWPPLTATERLAAAAADGSSLPTCITATINITTQAPISAVLSTTNTHIIIIIIIQGRYF